MVTAPAAMFEDSNIDDDSTQRRDGRALEATSDAVDEVNILKAKMRGRSDVARETPVDVYEPSRFDAEKDKTQFRQYEAACARVQDFYRAQHEKQTVAHNLQARIACQTRVRAEMSVWQAMEKLDTLLDDSDPDTSLGQIAHLLQSAEAIRRDGRPRWFQLTGLIHDLGKLLFFYGAEGQWDVVGDTFPVGCRFDEAAIVYPGSFDRNPDRRDPVYGSEHGIYAPGCGLDNVLLSWGHDEYLYQICREQSRLPDEALAMIRYHSFYPWHSAGAYRWMMDAKDERMLAAVQAFNPYDLYSKSDAVPNAAELKPYYMELINEFFPPREGEESRVLRW